MSNRYQTLPEIRQVVFAKVHKAASSTVQNVLLRFALARNLSVLLRKRGHNIDEQSSHILHDEMLPHPYGKRKFDILCSHLIYNHEEIAHYFRDDTVRVAILREPMKQAISALVYYASKWPVPQITDGIAKYPKDPINGFIRNPEDFYQPHEVKGPLSCHTNNRMSLDLGLNHLKMDANKSNKTKVQEFVRKVHEEFDLVLITEYFDASMVWLRRHLRWSLKDIIYIRSNTEKDLGLPANSPLRHRPNVTPEVTQKFRQWAVFDYALYDHFLHVFLEAIKAEPKFEEELKFYKQIKADVNRFCLNKHTRLENMLVPSSVWNEDFTISRTDCQFLTMSETSFVRIIKKKQMQRYNEFKKKISQPRKKFSNVTQK